MREWVKIALGNNLVFPHLRIIYPSAPARPYTPADGMMQSVWFDR